MSMVLIFLSNSKRISQNVGTIPLKVEEETLRKRNLVNLNPSAHSTTALILLVSLHRTVSLFMFRFRDKHKQTTSRFFVSKTLGADTVALPSLPLLSTFEFV